MAWGKDFDTSIHAKNYARFLRDKFTKTNFGVAITYDAVSMDYIVHTYMDGRFEPAVRQRVEMNIMRRDYELPIIPTEEVFATLMLLGAE